MKTLRKMMTILLLAGMLLALAAAWFARKNKPSYICLYGDPSEE